MDGVIILTLMTVAESGVGPVAETVAIGAAVVKSGVVAEMVVVGATVVKSGAVGPAAEMVAAVVARLGAVIAIGAVIAKSGAVGPLAETIAAVGIIVVLVVEAVVSSDVNLFVLDSEIDARVMQKGLKGAVSVASNTISG